ncbi:MAG TPA: serine hydrolase, partial [Planctomycetota bacterium]|nr:serine hydrolase [Planctomycetota bacterium]
MRRNRVLQVVALALVATLGCGAYVGIPAMRAAAGYAAKIACTAVYVANRDIADVQREDLAFLPMSSWIHLELDRSESAVTARLGPVSQRAICRQELGSTLVLGPHASAIHGEPVLAFGHLMAPPPPPSIAALGPVLDRAFAEPDPKHPRRTRAVVVVHHDQVVGQRYAPGFESSMPLLGWSMSKSVLSALIGIRVRQGKLKISDPPGCPEWSAPGDPRAAITIDHLLHMSSGLAWEERYAPGADPVNMLFLSPDNAAYAAAKPLAHPPGSFWQYSSGTSNILARALRQTFGGDETAYRAFPRKELFSKLGFTGFMELDASGTFVASSFTYMSARDWANFGLLYLHDGVAPDGTRILPEGWVAYTRTPAPAAPKGRYGAQFWLNAGSPGHPEDRAMPRLPTDLFYCAGFQDQS